MASRQEEKERRKQERLEREAAAAAATKRKRRVQLIGAVVVVAAIVAGVALTVAGGGGGSAEKLQDAAKDAGCVYRAFPEEGREHQTEPVTVADFKTNPPTSGNHHPEPAPDGAYPPTSEPEIGQWVHTLEHGRVLFQYRPGIDDKTLGELEKLFNEEVGGSGGGYHTVLMRNNSKMRFEVAAVAWRHYMGCEGFTPKTIKALRTFREERVDKAPENIP